MGKVMMQIYLIILWILVGSYVLFTFESIPKFVYGTLLFLYILKMFETLSYRCEEYENKKRK